MRTYLFLLTIFFLTANASSMQAVTVHVPGEYPTIQAGIDACTDGDTVLVADGTYTGDGNRDIDFGGRAIVVTSENGPEMTIIDCEADSLDLHYGFYFRSRESLSSVVQGFTITNGNHYSGGGINCFWDSSPTITNNIISGNMPYGIYSYESSPTITNNIISYNDGTGIGCNFDSSPNITNNIITRNGRGIWCANHTSPIITNNVISENTSWAYDGAGISIGDASPTISNNIISGNSAYNKGGGIRASSYESSIITNNIITGNTAAYGGGIYCRIYNVRPAITNNTIVGNTASDSGGGIFFDMYDSRIIANTILWDNSAPTGPEIYVSSGSLIVAYSNVQGGWPGEGNIDADPLFFTLGEFEYFLDAGSPCIDAGGPLSRSANAPTDDGISDWHPRWPDWIPNSPHPDMGAYGGPGNVGWLQ